MALGYRELVWIGHPSLPVDGSRPPYSRQEREAGVRQAIEGRDVSLRQFDIAYDSPATCSQLPDFLRSLHPGVGVIAGQAYQARWLAHEAASIGLRAPYDFGLVCCDDGYDVTSMWPGLSRVSFDRFGMGVTAAEMMLQILQHPKRKCPSRVMSGRWIAGNTAWGPDNVKSSCGRVDLS
jgi:DNA-binding LacI/PurR family transcriptional regulator